MYFVYLIECSDKSIYTGITTDVQRRFKEHSLGKGGAYTRSRQVVKVLYTEQFKTRSKAQKRESEIKGWRRDKKLALIKKIETGSASEEGLNYFKMIEENSIIKLCQEGMKMEGLNKPDDAYALYMKAWNDSSNDYEFCIAAHFVARQQKNLKDTLHWNMESLNRANLVNSDSVKNFYPSLYLCVSLSHEKLGNYVDAKKFLDLASGVVGQLADDDYGKGIRKNIYETNERINKQSEEHQDLN